MVRDRRLEIGPGKMISSCFLESMQKNRIYSCNQVGQFLFEMGKWVIFLPKLFPGERVEQKIDGSVDDAHHIRNSLCRHPRVRIGV